jgi:hypothetical protein
MAEILRNRGDNAILIVDRQPHKTLKTVAPGRKPGKSFALECRALHREKPFELRLR